MLYRYIEFNTELRPLLRITQRYGANRLSIWLNAYNGDLHVHAWHPDGAWYGNQYHGRAMHIVRYNGKQEWFLTRLWDDRTITEKEYATLFDLNSMLDYAERKSDEEVQRRLVSQRYAPPPKARTR